MGCRDPNPHNQQTKAAQPFGRATLQPWPLARLAGGDLLCAAY